MRSATTSVSSRSVQAQLGLCAAAIAGTAAMSSTAEAVVVTTFENTMIPVPATLAGVYLHFVTGATASSGAALPGWDFNPYQTTSGLGFYWSPDLVGGLRGAGVATGPATNLYADLPLGTVVQASDNYTSAIQGTSANFRSTGTHYLGFRFSNNGVLNFGYLAISTTAGAGNLNGFPATILGWRYEDSGGPITTAQIGGVVPEPSSAACLLALAAGASGVRGWRRRRAA